LTRLTLALEHNTRDDAECARMTFFRAFSARGWRKRAKML
jgi:hypothetical protein